MADPLDSTLREVAAEREEIHSDHASSRPLSEDYERVGILGEAEFALRYGYRFDRERRPAGDKGIDFIVPVMHSLDVKTARKPFNLIVEVGKVFADLYVLAGIDEADKVEFLGWEKRETVIRAPSRDFGYGVINHFIPAINLRKMVELEKRLGAIRAGAR